VSVWIDITVTVHYRWLFSARLRLWLPWLCPFGNILSLIQRSFIETISQSIFFREALPSTHSIPL